MREVPPSDTPPRRSVIAAKISRVAQSSLLLLDFSLVHLRRFRAMSGSDRYPLRAELEAYTKPKYKEYNVHSEDGSLMWCKDHVDGKYENTTKGWAVNRCFRA